MKGSVCKYHFKTATLLRPLLPVFPDLRSSPDTSILLWLIHFLVWFCGCKVGFFFPLCIIYDLLFSLWFVNYSPPCWFFKNFFILWTRVWTQSLHLEPLHQPFFVMVFFQDRVWRTIFPGCPCTVILLISASWVAVCLTRWAYIPLHGYTRLIHPLPSGWMFRLLLIFFLIVLGFELGTYAC
jgi:hypothetical protein